MNHIKLFCAAGCLVWALLIGCSSDDSNTNGASGVQTPAADTGSGVSDTRITAEDASDVAIRVDATDVATQPDAPTPVPERTTITVGELVFDAWIGGPEEGEPVILLHGFPQTSREWLAQIDALSAAGYRVVAPDQRGYSPGARPEAVEDYALPRLVEDVLGIADALGIDRFHLVGHDWGASVVWSVATTAPERLLSLNPISVPHLDAFTQVLADPTSCQYEASAYFDTFISPSAESTLLGSNGAFLRAIYAGLPPETVDFYVTFFSDEAALTGGLNWYRANIEDRQTKGDPLGLVQVPTMFIWSDGDTALCREGAELTGDFVQGPYRFEIIEGVNHWVPELAAEQVNALLLDHLADNADDR